jgi:multisubunit Na+/H+ antiporter MnhB subunit
MSKSLPGILSIFGAVVFLYGLYVTIYLNTYPYIALVGLIIIGASMVWNTFTYRKKLSLVVGVIVLFIIGVLFALASLNRG